MPLLSVIQNERLKENIDLVADAARDVHIRPAIECGGAIIRVEKINAESGNRESFGLAGSRWTGDDEHPRRHLAAEIAVCPLAHIFGKIGAHAFSGLIGDSETLQL